MGANTASTIQAGPINHWPLLGKKIKKASYCLKEYLSILRAGLKREIKDFN